MGRLIMQSGFASWRRTEISGPPKPLRGDLENGTLPFCMCVFDKGLKKMINLGIFGGSVAVDVDCV